MMGKKYRRCIRFCVLRADVVRMVGLVLIEVFPGEPAVIPLYPDESRFLSGWGCERADGVYPGQGGSGASTWDCLRVRA
jgi:hypothetical protein